MFSIFKKDPLANFGFLGAHIIDFANQYEEKRSNTKRFRVYKYAIEQFFGTIAFTHFINEENSTYLIVNNKYESVDQIAQSANDMFLELYPQLEGV
ncbi:MAG: hypothetical protein ACOYKR_04550 [Sphingobacterium thalpophilum]